MTVYDVLIIGAGPAGGSTAFHAAKNGLKTLVLEEHKAIGEPVHCGECLSELAIRRMGWSLPDEVVALDVQGVRVLFPGDTQTKLSEPGYVLDKHLFEQWIMAQAQSHGAQLQLSKKVVSLSKASGVWTVACADNTSYQAHVLVDASGVAAIVSRLLGLNERFQSVIGMQYEMLDIPTDGYLDFYIWPDLAPHGYLWMIPKNDGRANVGLVTNQNTKAKPFLDEFVRKMGWQDKKVVKTFGGLIPSSGPLKNTVADGLMLVGDAAGFTSPLFEGGTHLGLMSGRFAAQVAQEALEKNDVSLAALKKYDALWQAEFPDYNKLIQGKMALYDFSDEELSALGGLMPPELAHLGFSPKAKFAVDVLTRKPGLLKKNLFSALKAFGYSRAEYYGW
ncbi:NAD(P)/FAD-dependent oxidoreductase [Candidatus Micrarchaeota archaeon]|nr:NAD(P)/FAD-dependent oxidoreductase [Candidatus Micrarchaeota archaeon]